MGLDAMTDAGRRTRFGRQPVGDSLKEVKARWGEAASLHRIAGSLVVVRADVVIATYDRVGRRWLRTL